MAGRRADLFATVRTEGALLPSELLARAAGADPSLPGTGLETYHLGRADRFGEVITRSWNALQGHWATFTDDLARLPETDPATSATRERWLQPLFRELGYGRVQGAGLTEVDGKTYPVSHRWEHVPMHLVGANVDIDRRSPGVWGAAGMSPHAVVQELLNRSDDRLWGLVSNGRVLRLLRDNASLTRQAYVEFDLEAMFTGQVYADFVVLWMLCHQSRVEGDPANCWLERWTAEAAAQGTRALDALRAGVEDALVALGRGFLAHRSSGDLGRRLRAGDLGKDDYYRQLLRLVYRLLFLFVAEDRDLLLRPDAPEAAKARYREHYSLGRVRRLAQRRKGSAHGDLWLSLRPVFAALGHPDGLPALGLPGLGSFLWSDEATPDLDTAAIANRDLLDAVRALALTPDVRAKAFRLVDYRNLGAEELGSVYESLLELHPDVDLEATDPAGVFRLGTAAGHERKTTGSYYTPTSLIDQLLDTALDPVLDEKAAADDPEAAILGMTVLDPACGSGHFLVAAAHRLAARLASVRAGGGEPSPDATRAALRDVVGRCLHGIDVNEMAVELCKVSLWMEAIDPGRPLSFLDQRIVCGNGLVGATPALVEAGIPDDAFKPLTGDDNAVVTSLKKQNKAERAGQGKLSLTTAAELQQPLADALEAVDALPDDDVRAVAEKEARWRAAVAAPEARQARLVADAWCAAFVLPKAKGAPAVTSGVLTALRSDPDAAPADVVAAVDAVAAQFRFLHWHLAFPQVFRVPADGEDADNPTTGWSGGFDVVLGNPPWEKVKLAEKEFFAARSPEIAAAPNAAARKKLIAALASDDPTLFGAFNAALRVADGESHLLRSTGRFPLCGRGDVNTYAVFAEAMRDGVGPTGRAGVIVPTGIATDDTTKYFFGDLVAHGSIASLYDFENQQKLFADVDSRMKFCLLTLSGRSRPVPAASFAFFARTVADLADPDRVFTLAPDDFALLNPNTRTCPVFRTRRDAELTKAIYRRVPVLVDETRPDGNPWGVSFMRMIDMSNDSHLFRTRVQLVADGWTLDGNLFRRGAETYLPLYEGRLGHQFNHRFASEPSGELRETPEALLMRPDHSVEPHYWISSSEAEHRLSRRTLSCKSALLGFRRVARNNDERTCIAALLPFGAASYGWILSLGPSASELAQLCANYNSFVFDFLLRSSLSQPSVPIGTFKQVPTLARLPDIDLDWLRPRVLELTYTAHDLGGFARDLGYDGLPFRWDDERRALLRAELDACFFHLYGIERDDVDYILETFPIVKRKDEAAHGEYRTKRLILEIYDAMAKAADTGEPYETRLSPAPADPSLAHP